MKLAYNKKRVKKYSAIVCAFVMTLVSVVPSSNWIARAESNVAGENSEGEVRPVTKEDMELIHQGKITLEDGRTDSSLVNRDIPLDPEADDDGDGLKNNQELFTIVKNGKKYLYYKSHPLLEDTDGDGFTDNRDRDPLKWDVTPRDAILFQELSYRNDDYVKQVLNFDLSSLELYEGRPEYSLMRRELAPYWEFQESYHDNFNGFDATIFKFSNKTLPFLKDNDVHVLGIRGTSGPGDAKADANLAVGIWPDQATTAYLLADKVNKYPDRYRNIYVTGHSLGGYLSQMFFVRSLGEKYGNPNGNPWRKNWNYWDKNKKNNDNVKGLFTFNAPKIKSSPLSYWGWEYAELGDYLTEIYHSKHYTVANDNVTTLTGAFKGYINLEASDRGHSSRSFFEDRYINVPGFSIGNRRGLSGEGYIQDNLKDIVFNKPTTVVVKDVEKTDETGEVYKTTFVKKWQYEVNNIDKNTFLPEGYEFLNESNSIKIGENNVLEVRKKNINIIYNFKEGDSLVKTEKVSTKYRTGYSLPEIPGLDDEKYEYTYEGKELPKIEESELTTDKVIDVPLKKSPRKVETIVKFFDGENQIGDNKKIETLATDEAPIEIQNLLPEGYKLKDTNVNILKGQENNVNLSKKIFTIKFNFISSDGKKFDGVNKDVNYREAASIPVIPDGYILDSSVNLDIPKSVTENKEINIYLKPKEPEKYMLKIKFVHNGTLKKEVNVVAIKDSIVNLDLPEELKEEHFILDKNQPEDVVVDGNKDIEVKILKSVPAAIISPENLIYNVKVDYMYGDRVVKTSLQKVKNGEKPVIESGEIVGENGRKYRIKEENEIKPVDDKDKAKISLKVEPTEYMVEILYKNGNEIVKKDIKKVKSGDNIAIPEKFTENGKVYSVEKLFNPEKINGDITISFNVKEYKEPEERVATPEKKSIKLKYEYNGKIIKEENTEQNIGERLKIDIASLNEGNGNSEGRYVLEEGYNTPVISSESDEFIIPVKRENNVYSVNTSYVYNGKEVLRNEVSVESGNLPEISKEPFTDGNIEYLIDESKLNLKAVTSENKDETIIIPVNRVVTTNIEFVDENNKKIGETLHIKTNNDDNVVPEIPEGYSLADESQAIRPAEDNVVRLVKNKAEFNVNLVYKFNEREIIRKVVKVLEGETPDFRLNENIPEERAILHSYILDSDNIILPSITAENYGADFEIKLNKIPEESKTTENTTDKETVNQGNASGSEEKEHSSETKDLTEKQEKNGEDKSSSGDEKNTEDTGNKLEEENGNKSSNKGSEISTKEENKENAGEEKSPVKEENSEKETSERAKEENSENRTSDKTDETSGNEGSKKDSVQLEISFKNNEDTIYRKEVTIRLGKEPKSILELLDKNNSEEKNILDSYEIDDSKVDFNKMFDGNNKKIILDVKKKEKSNLPTKDKVTKDEKVSTSKEVNSEKSGEEKNSKDVSSEKVSEKTDKVKSNNTGIIVRHRSHSNSGNTETVKEENTKSDTERISGADRVATSVEVSKKMFPKGADTVIVANGDKYADVLSAVPYAKINKAPILYTGQNETPEMVVNEIKRLGAKKVVLVGGNNTISDKQKLKFKEMGYNIDEIGGKDRYETSAKIAERIVKMSGNKKNIIVANGENFPDALSVTSLAVKNESPVLLINKDRVSQEISNVIGKIDGDNIIIAGGENSISPSAEKDIYSKVKKSVVRLSGKDRYETSAKISEYGRKNSEVGIIASGEDFPDALAGATLTYEYNAPVLLVKKDALPSTIDNYISSSKIKKKIIVGGENTVSKEVEETLKNK